MKQVSKTRTLSFVTFSTVYIFVVSLLIIPNHITIHDSELRFAEHSMNSSIVGGMIPASCESGGNNLVGPSHVSACVWTQYCTGGNDANGNNWQVWQYSNDDSIDYQNTGNGCAPTVNVNVN